MKLYIIVDSKLPTLAYKSVQGMHAVAQYCSNFGAKSALETMIFVEHGNINNFLKKMYTLTENCAWFNEPDLDGALTAVCVLCCEKTQRILKKLPLVS